MREGKSGAGGDGLVRGGASGVTGHGEGCGLCSHCSGKPLEALKQRSDMI